MVDRRVSDSDTSDETNAEETSEDEEMAFPPVNTTAPQLTVRAIVTGMFFGALLSFVNIYTGLKIGWGFNMSITAMLLSFGFYKFLEPAGVQKWGLLENNISQTAASAGANISSAGLVAPIPALTMITGATFAWHILATWTFAVAFVGVVVAVGLRRQMLIVDRLPFPSGIASAETIKQMYAEGKEAMVRVWALLIGGLFGGAMKMVIHLAKWKKWGLPGSFAAGTSTAGTGAYTLGNLGFALDPSPLMVAVGAIIGVRAGASMIVGAIIAWGFLAPMALDAGWAAPGALDATSNWFGSINKWMLWPGVALMVTSSLTSFAFSWRSIVAAIRGASKAAGGERGAEADAPGEVPRRWFIIALVVALVLASVTQVAFFDIPLWVAILAVLLTFVLAIVAGRVAGETGITPVGAMGKVTQLTFGIVSPGNAASNLMAANVTGGAASQTADLLHDMKAGLLIGASARLQAVAQFFGVLSGALAGCAVYLFIIPDPATMLLTEEWPAPAVQAWKGVAELFMEGIEAMPTMAATAMGIAGAAGVVLAILEKVLPKKTAKWVPSPAAMGIAFVIPASYSISMFLGGLISFLGLRFAKTWTKRFLIVIASGIVAGEGLVGVGIAIHTALKNAMG